MKYWKTKDNKRLAIKNMETIHIINCLKLLSRGDPSLEIEITMAEENGFNYSAFSMRETQDKFDDAINSFEKELRKREEKI